MEMAPFLMQAINSLERCEHGMGNSFVTQVKLIWEALLIEVVASQNFILTLPAHLYSLLFLSQEIRVTVDVVTRSTTR